MLFPLNEEMQELWDLTPVHGIAVVSEASLDWNKKDPSHRPGSNKIMEVVQQVKQIVAVACEALVRCQI